jgi:alpha/beta superfamily hydrolase
MKKTISFLSDNLKLEGMLYYPEAQSNLAGAIVLHPHPQFGGSMDNNVVDAICEQLEHSMIALKFNCRGVGGSEGHSTGGKEEGKDVLAAISYLKTNKAVDQEKLVFIGYSWGTFAGLPVTHKNPDIQVVVAISCPVGMWNYDYLKECIKPKLLIVGTHDQFAPLDKTTQLFNQLSDPKELYTLKTDHFYMGQEKNMADKVTEFLKKYRLLK